MKLFKLEFIVLKIENRPIGVVFLVYIHKF